jgi:ribosomal protein S18 acetylase RimI-like enzyme
MTTREMPSSNAAMTDSLGREAAMHLDLVWRDLMKSRGSVETAQFFRLITGEQHPLGNVAILREGQDATILQEAVAPLLALVNPVAVMFVTGVGDAVSESLLAQGFSRLEPMPAMAVDMAALQATKLPEGYEFFRVTSDADGSAFADVLTAGFELPRGLARLLSPEVQDASTEADSAVQFFAIRRTGKLVATSMLYLANGLAGIYCVATLPEERGQGLGAHVTAEALRVAQRLGYGAGVLQSSAAGHSVYRALGFQDLGAVSMYVKLPS